MWCDLARISLEDRRRGRIDLTYRQLMVRLGVPLATIDTGDGPGVVLDPAWGEGLRTVQRTLDELEAGGWVSKGYVPNVEGGGHRLCLVMCAPDWFRALVAEVVQLARVKGGRKAKRAAVPEQTRPRPPMIESRDRLQRDVPAAKRGLDAARAALANARAGP